MRSTGRRDALITLATLAAWPAFIGGNARAASDGADLCANGTVFDTPLPTPGRDGWMGYCDTDSPFLMRAGTVDAAPFPLAYTVARDGRRWQNPILVARAGSTMRATLANALDEATIVHWHGLAVDSFNDGNGDRVAAPGARFDYAFPMRNRAGLYWYHPHPHGITGGQQHRGLFGALLVDDDEDRALGTALATTRGDTDLVLVLADRRAASRSAYAPSATDRQAGYLGDEMLVNGVAHAWRAVATRGYRLRILNAANARTFRLALRGDDGDLIPFALLGTDGGLLARPIPCRELFVASAERVDLWVDFSARALGDSVVLESLPFDPMHGESHASGAAAATAHGDHDHGNTNAVVGAAPSSIADGARLSLLQFRIRERVAASPPPPPTLSSLAAPRDGREDAVPFRLSFAKSRWRINDRVFDMQQEPLIVPRNTQQTWLLRNYYTSMPHAMHLHGFAMRVLAREQSPDFITALAIDDKGRLATDAGVKDTVLVWPGESVRVAIDFACTFAGPQDYLLHCHNAEHEDGGMMLRVRVA
jgi:FtsP/CotA-like multicopper oxidase with cupredoxin domain